MLFSLVSAWSSLTLCSILMYLYLLAASSNWASATGLSASAEVEIKLFRRAHRNPSSFLHLRACELATSDEAFERLGKQSGTMPNSYPRGRGMRLGEESDVLNS